MGYIFKVKDCVRFIHFKTNIMKQLYKNILGFIEKEEKNLSAKRKIELEDAYHMVVFLRHLLTDLKSEVLSTGFENKQEEITFFKSIKPEVLGKLIYYNKIVRIESFRPCSSEMLSRYYTDHIKCLKKEYKKHIGNTDFYRYHRSGRTDKDDLFFRRGNINFFDGVNSFIFEADPAFSTFYDYKTARIIAFDLIHNYLLCCLEPERSNPIFDEKVASKKVFSWTHSKNALIELIYALHVSGSLSHGRGSIKKTGRVFEELFEISLGDIHHAFHQMKFRAGEKASFLLYLKDSLEQYMERDL